jgi:membrane protease subunit (stomatin/prohibitin family)
VAGTATAVSGRVRRRQDARWAQEDDPQQDYQQQGQQPAAAPPAASAEADYTAELEKLAKLRDEGVITADDFDAKKKQLLGI